MHRLTAFIIEDEPRAQKLLENLLAANFPDIEVLGSAPSVKGSVEWLRTNEADIIFMDVELQDGNSFQIFDQVDIKGNVIMTTAYDSYAVKAFEVNSLDYLLKPIEIEDLRRAISRAVNERASSEKLPPPPQGQPKEKYIIRLNDCLVPLKAREILCFYSEAKNTCAVRTDGSALVMDESLDNIEREMDRRRFFRISRSCIIADDAVESVTKLVGSRLRIVPSVRIKGSPDLTVSRARVDSFLDWLQG